jgi:twitching motility two-component system response regulator PilH
MTERRRILYIDDNLLNLRLVQKGLKSSGYELLMTHDVEQGLVWATSQTPALIFLDFHMPDKNGLDLLQELKAQPHTQHIPVIMLSADSSGTVQQQAKQLGCVDYLVKPVSQTALLRAIEQHVGSAKVGEATPPTEH